MMDSSNEWSKTEIFHHVRSEVLTLRLRAHKISTFERRRKKKRFKSTFVNEDFWIKKKKISEQESGIRIHVGWIQVFSCCVHSQSQRTAREAKTSKFHLMKDVMGRLEKKTLISTFLEGDGWENYKGTNVVLTFLCGHLPVLNAVEDTSCH